MFLDGELIDDRKSPPDDEIKDPIGDVRNAVSVAEVVRTKVLTTLQELDAKQLVGAGAAH